MEIQLSNQYCILTPLSPKIDGRETLRLQEEIVKYKNLIIGLDLSFVQDCTIEFLEALSSLHASCFNIQSDIFSLLNIMNFDKSIPLYASEEDFKLNRRRLLNRKFTVL